MTCAQLSTAGFPVSDSEYASLSLFVEVLLDENRRLNLTAIRTPEGAWPLHVCDSLALSPLIRRLQPRRVLDLGTGGGVPGIPLACVHPEIEWTLLDATRKKVDAAMRIAAAVGLTNVRGVWGRAEALGVMGPHRGAYDAVVARAVAKLPGLIPLSTNFLRTGGIAWFMKSAQSIEGEVTAANAIAGKQGLRYLGMASYRLPAPHGERAIAEYSRVSEA
jgi:16S rRNA (guanine527-N7)-methyltransferase